ncbi:MAG TPA: septal ring lytic transglycosylase RlpA family protein [Thermoanaerobaculia bacterium]|nr:septal ring lytic transglycosylase RlpA family protein [Thermoanaerobaculia bacterium]
MRLRSLSIALILFTAYGCATTAPPPPRESDVLRGVASWYGEEFAGRTTANGEIFDPLQLTAAHRSLPFGTVLDVTNGKTNQTVRVRINDRGPYVGNRVLDLSYAAARHIGLIQPGSGEVEMKIVRLGKGEREPPVPYVVNIEEPKEKVVIPSGEAPAVPFPLPSQTRGTSTEDGFSVEVVEEQRGVPTRRQVSADGRSLEDVPITGDAEVPSAVLDRATLARTRPAPPPRAGSARFVVQAGAFSVESNARSLQDRLARIGHNAYLDREKTLFRVRLGPFASREEALKTRSALEAQGMSAIVMPE